MQVVSYSKTDVYWQNSNYLLCLYLCKKQDDTQYPCIDVGITAVSILCHVQLQKCLQRVNKPWCSMGYQPIPSTIQNTKTHSSVKFYAWSIFISSGLQFGWAQQVCTESDWRELLHIGHLKKEFNFNLIGSKTKKKKKAQIDKSQYKIAALFRLLSSIVVSV